MTEKKMRTFQKTMFTVVLSTAGLLGFSAMAEAAALPAGVTCTGKHVSGGSVCYDSCTVKSTGEKISGSFHRDGLWHDGGCAIIVRQSGAAEQKEKARAGQGVGSGSIFDRWGNLKTKASCESAGGGWIKSEGKSSCKPRVDNANKQ